MIIKDDIELEIVFSKEEKTVYIGTLHQVLNINAKQLEI